jgi:hypothetical protein
MVGNILNSPRAVDTSVQIVRAFVKMRTMLATHSELATKFDALEKKYEPPVQGSV